MLPPHEVWVEAGPQSSWFAVILPCRDPTRGESVADEIRAAQKVSGCKADVKVLEMDLSSLPSVEACVKCVEGLHVPLHILINNGGIYDLGGAAFGPVQRTDSEKKKCLRCT